MWRILNILFNFEEWECVVLFTASVYIGPFGPLSLSLFSFSHLSLFFSLFHYFGGRGGVQFNQKHPKKKPTSLPSSETRGKKKGEERAKDVLKTPKRRNRFADGGGGGGSGGGGGGVFGGAKTRAQRVIIIIIIIIIIEQQKLREKDEELFCRRDQKWCGTWGWVSRRKDLDKGGRKDDDEEEKSSRGKENASREGEVVERMVRGC